MTPPHAQSASVERPRADIAARAEPTGPFVVNLCSSTTPMALSQPQDPALKRFTFFVSRRLEDGRERFRLHMGYFETLPEAEEWVGVVREFYPGAWAGEAPGKRLRAREQQAAAVAAVASVVTAASAATVASAVPVAPAAAVAPAASIASVRAAPSVASAAPRQHSAPPQNVPVLQPASEPAQVRAPKAASAAVPRPSTAAAPASAAAMPAAPTPVAAIPVAPTPASPARRASASNAPASTAPAPTRAGPAPAAAASASPASSASSASSASATPAAPAAPPQTSRAQSGGSVSAAAAGKADKRAPAGSKPSAGKAATTSPSRLSNVREVMASLDETDATREMPAPSAPRALERAQEPDSDSSLTDTQVLRLLEDRRADGKSAEPDTSISLLKPDDTGTRRALKEAVVANVPVSFAVQLQWSVQPIDVAKVPPLAIFGAYTLYTVEGSREGRRWYGLRLGFFSDAISAKQVAHYVRSEFNSVAVVPVSPHERTRACDTGGNSGASPSESTSSGANATSGGSASQSGGARPSASVGTGTTVGIGPSAGSGASSASSAGSASNTDVSKASKPSGRSPVRDRLPEPTTEFKLFDDEPPRVPEKKPPAAKPRTAARVPSKRAAKGPAGRVRARDKRSPQTLEETLEILGADELEIDDRRVSGASSNGVRPLRVPERRNSPFSKLLDRLSERSRKDR